jgi:hypothetical protein
MIKTILAVLLCGVVLVAGFGFTQSWTQHVGGQIVTTVCSAALIFFVGKLAKKWGLKAL